MAPGILKSQHSFIEQLVNDKKDKHLDGSSQGSPLQKECHVQEPIAIIGMGCRLPGGVNSPSKLWDLLVQKRSAQSSIPTSRFNIDGFYHPDVERPGSITAAGGYFLDEDIRLFDNDFFGINNLEAKYMDAEQRKLLEVVFECFENAGKTLKDVSGENIGCYVGKFTYDYLTMQNKDPEYLHRYSATGMSTAILANRVSHVYNLQGPSLVVDTACSSSLYCLHMACTALDIGDCDSAIVAGVNLIQSPEQHIATMKAGVLSPTSTCHTFDAAADGYGRGENVGALYLKRLSDAIRDGDSIRSVIRGTSVNSNGHTAGITLPSASRQEAVIRQAYARAGLSHEDTDYVECHGTGTAVGDVIEVEGLSRVFERARDRPILVGSIKPNVGHSEAASAISSIIKVTLALERGEIPATYGITCVNPNINADALNVNILTENTVWPSKVGSNVRRASVNSFGFGGANAHAVLDAADSHVPVGYNLSSKSLALARTTLLLPFSASNQSSLEGRVNDLGPICEDGVSIIDLARTLGDHRSNLGVKGYLLASQQSLHDDLQLHNLRTLPSRKQALPHPIAFVFTGQGAQWPQMGQELMQEFAAFRHTIIQLDTALQSIRDPPSWTIQDTLIQPANTSKINQAAYSQPVCTAIQIALLDLLADWGVKAQYFVGHSSGEICAGYAAGHISAKQAIILAYYRGYACSNAEKQGAMLALGTNYQEAVVAIDTLGIGRCLRVACINSPESVTISGDCNEITRLRVHFQGLNVFARELHTDGKAYHSHHMALVGQVYQDLMTTAIPSISEASKGEGNPQWISTVTGRPVDSKVDYEYWRLNLESPVQFSKAIDELSCKPGIHFIEIGPHSVLELPIKQTLFASKADLNSFPYNCTLSRGKPSVQTLLSLMGELFLHNHSVSFPLVNKVDLLFKSQDHQKQGKLVLNIPNYQWKHDAVLWNECRASDEFRNRKYKRHDILGSQLPGMDGAVSVWRNMLKIEHVPWVQDHRIDGMIVFPAAGYIAMVIEAACQITGADPLNLPPCHLQNVNIVKALVLSEEESSQGVEIFTTLLPTRLVSMQSQDKSWQFSITSCLDGGTISHADGTISFEIETKLLRPEILFHDEEVEMHSVGSWYDRLSEAGLNFSGLFRSLTEIKGPKKKDRRLTVARTHIHRGGVNECQSIYSLHPATLDGILHTALIASAAGSLKDFRLRIPVAIKSLRIQMPPGYDSEEPLIIHGAAEPIGLDSMQTSVEVRSRQYEPFIQVQDCRLITPFQEQQDQTQERQPMLEVVWKPDITSMGHGNPGIISDYVDKNPVQICQSAAEAELGGLLGVLDLMAHKDPGLRIAQIGNVHAAITETLLELLQFDTAFKRCRSYGRCTISTTMEVLFESAKVSLAKSRDFSKGIAASDHSIDVILFLHPISTEEGPLSVLQRVREVLAPGGSLMGIFTPPEIDALETAEFSITHSTAKDGSAFVIARQFEEQPDYPFSNTESKEVILVHRSTSHPLDDVLEVELSKAFGHPIKRLQLNAESLRNLVPGSIIISSIEIQQPILSTISESELELVKILTGTASRLLWVTGGRLLTGAQPDFAIVFGLSRAVMLEQPAMKFLTFDIDDLDSDLHHTVANLLFVLAEGLRETTRDFEYIQDGGTLYVSRFVPEKNLNSIFRQKQGLENVPMQLQETRPCQLSFERPKQLDTAYFKKLELDRVEPGPGIVEIEVDSVDIDTHSASILSGKFSTDDTALTIQCVGVVTKVGTAVSSVAIGDRVVTLAPGEIASTARIPDWACVKLKGDEENVSDLPILSVSCMALYALRKCARIAAGESVLVSSGFSDFGISVIQIAQDAGAEIFSTIHSQAEEDFLVEVIGMKRNNLFNAESPTLLADILAATKHQRIQTVLSSTIEESPSAIWEACADFGTLVEIGLPNANRSDRLVLAISSRSITCTSFNLPGLFNVNTDRSSRIWAWLLKESMALFREGKLKTTMPAETYDVSQMTQAFEHLKVKSQIGKAVISLENPKSIVRVLPVKYETCFRASKTYLLIGCLGGLGRSMSKWMFERGARKFMFLGRSGLERQIARDFVNELQKEGAEIQVVQGDVGVFADLEKAVGQIQGPIGGVIQAAMGLDESIFSTMTHQQWHTAMAPKVLGTWNVHNAIKARDSELDFFLMTSSISGSVGVATESNYCASNYFLDMFARFRRSMSLPATSIGFGMISQIGYLHEHPEIQNGLIHKGVSAIDASDFLQILDAALSKSASNQGTIGPNPDRLCKSHILTGLEPLGLRELRKKGFEGVPATFDDPRAVLLNDALSDGNSGQGNAFSSGLPPELASAIQEGASLLEMVLSLIAKQFSNFLLTPLEKLDTAKPLASFGMDSMLAAAVRAWFYKKFKVDLAFMTLLSQTVSIGDLAKTVSDAIVV